MEPTSLKKHHKCPLRRSFPMDIIIQGVNQLNYTISDKGFTFYTLTGNGQVQEISVFVPLKEIIYYLKPNLILVKDYLVAHSDYKLTSYYLNITCCPKIETQHT